MNTTRTLFGKIYFKLNCGSCNRDEIGDINDVELDALLVFIFHRYPLFALFVKYPPCFWGNAPPSVIKPEHF